VIIGRWGGWNSRRDGCRPDVPSKIAANERRKVIVARDAERRAELKAVIARPPRPTPSARPPCALNRQPRDASATRVRNRDVADGRPRGHLRKFGVSRVRFRRMAHDGQPPGVTRSSW